MPDALLSDGQAAALVSAVLGGFGAIAAAVRWGLGRGARSFDAMAQAFRAMADEHKALRESLIELRGAVQEGRNDIREIRDSVARAVDEPAPRRSRSYKAQTPPLGTRRATTESDR